MYSWGFIIMDKRTLNILAQCFGFETERIAKHFATKRRTLYQQPTRMYVLKHWHDFGDTL